MRPLDDELRAVLTSRADAVAPPGDPLAGVHARAARLHRSRVAGAVAGTVMAVAVVAVGVPTVLSGLHTSGGTSASTAAGLPELAAGSSGAVPPPATLAPALPSATAAPATLRAGLDPAGPWAYRGVALPGGALAEAQRAWSRVHPASTLVPLFAQTYGTAGQVELVGVGRDGGRWGVLLLPPTASTPASPTPASPGAQVELDQPLTPGATALDAVLPGDGAARLLVVAAPDSTGLRYLADATTRAELARAAPGVGTLTLTPGPFAGSRVQVLDRDGVLVHDRALPQAPASPGTSAAPGGQVDNALSWPEQGGAGGPARDAAAQAAGAALGSAGTTAQLRVLWSGEVQCLHVLVGQAWLDGASTALGFAYATGAASGPETFVGPPTPADPAVLAYQLSGTAASSTDVLVVVPAPGSQAVQYTADGGAPAAADPAAGTTGVFLLDRDRKAQADHLRVTGPDGTPTYDAAVASLLCGLTGCG